MTDEQQVAYAIGQAAGRDLAAGAGDCPYLPGAEAEERVAWLKGFGDARPDVSPGSDPAHARGRFQPSPPAAQQARHEG